MLSSFFKRKGGKQQNNQQGQQNQPGKQKQSTPQVYIPAKFHGEITANDHVLVENPKTFEVPIGVSVDPIFEHIRTNQYTLIEPILKSGYNLETKLFEGTYLHGILALYTGHVPAIKRFQESISSRYTAINTPPSKALATKIKQTKLDDFKKYIRSAIDDELTTVYNDTFELNHLDKANAILSLNMANWILKLLKNVQSPSPGGPDGPGGPGGPKDPKRPKGTRTTTGGGKIPKGELFFKDISVSNEEEVVGGNNGKKKKKRSKKPPSRQGAPTSAATTPPPAATNTAPPPTGTLDNTCGYFERQDDAASCGRHALNNLAGRKTFIKQEVDKTTGAVIKQKIDLTSPERPFSMIDFCNKLTTESKKLGLGTDIFNCQPNENYDIKILQFLIFLMGSTYEEFPAARVPEFVNYVTNGPPIIPMIINLGTITAGVSTGIHWVSARTNNETNEHCYYDSLNQTALNFGSRDDLIDHILNQSVVHILVVKQLPATDPPINIIDKLKEIGAQNSSSTAPATKGDVENYINQLDTNSLEILLQDLIAEYPVTELSVLGSGSMTGGRYSGPNYERSKPLSTQPTPAPPNWYEISPKSMNNITPLQYAIGYGSVDSVRVLIRNGSDFTVTTLAGISLRDLANSRKGNDFRAKDVKTLLEYVLDAYGAAYSDYNLKKMKENYIDEANLKDRERGEKETLNFVYEKTYKALKSGKSTTDVLGEVGETAKKRGKQDGLAGNPQDENQTTNSPSKEVRDGYELGYKLGQAEKAGTEDGNANVTTPRNAYYSDPSTPQEIKNAYMMAFQRVKGSNIYAGFKDGVTGKEKNPPGSGFLDFDPDLMKNLNFGAPDKKAGEDYDAGYNMGIQDFVANIKDIIDNAEQNGQLDGFNGNTRYTTKHILKVKPLQGGILSTGPAPTLTSMEYGKEKESFEVDYSNLDLASKYAVIPGIRIDSTRFSSVPMAGTNFAYGAYIQMLYKTGFTQGQQDKIKSGKGRSKTYRKRRHTKSKTYKKKLSRK